MNMPNNHLTIPFYLVAFVACLAPHFYGHPIEPKNDGPNSSDCAETKDLIVITDMEPDDRIALAIVASQLADRVLAIGATLLHAERKAALARHALIGTKLEGAQVLVGSGGTEESYPRMNSTEAALTYGDKEGKDILEDEVLDKLNKQNRCPNLQEGNEFQKYLKELLLDRKDGVKINFLVLAPPTDLTAVLCQNKELASSIGEIHLMGGWNEPEDPSTKVFRSSFNVNMDGEATARLLKMASNNEVKVVLYSSHVLGEQFAGGSISSKNFPKLIGMINESKAPCIEAFRKAGKSWDTNVVECHKTLKDIIGPHIGKQFTPADPITVLGFMKPALIKETVKMNVEVIVPDKQNKNVPHNVEKGTPDELEKANQGKGEKNNVPVQDEEILHVEDQKTIPDKTFAECGEKALPSVEIGKTNSGTAEEKNLVERETVISGIVEKKIPIDDNIIPIKGDKPIPIEDEKAIPVPAHEKKSVGDNKTSPVNDEEYLPGKSNEKFPIQDKLTPKKEVKKTIPEKHENTKPDKFENVSSVVDEKNNPSKGDEHIADEAEKVIPGEGISDNVEKTTADEAFCHPYVDGYEVKVEENPLSGITLITKFDVDMFGAEMERIMGDIDFYEANRHKTTTDKPTF